MHAHRWTAITAVIVGVATSLSPGAAASAASTPVVTMTAPTSGTVDFKTARARALVSVASGRTVSAVWFTVNGGTYRGDRFFTDPNAWIAGFGSEQDSRGKRYVVQAHAKDSAGSIGHSAEVTVVDVSPRVRVVEPVMQPWARGAAHWQAVAEAGRGRTITKVEMLDDNQRVIATDSSAPFEGVLPANWAGGMVYARATDSTGLQVLSNVGFNANGAGAEITPLANSAVGVGTPLGITIIGADPSTVTSVDWSVTPPGGPATPISTATRAPWGATWTPTVAGSHLLSAVVRATRGSISTSLTATAVTLPSTPSLVMTVPASAAPGTMVHVRVDPVGLPTGAVVTDVGFSTDVDGAEDFDAPYEADLPVSGLDGVMPVFATLQYQASAMTHRIHSRVLVRVSGATLTATARSVTPGIVTLTPVLSGGPTTPVGYAITSGAVDGTVGSDFSYTVDLRSICVGPQPMPVAFTAMADQVKGLGQVRSLTKDVDLSPLAGQVQLSSPANGATVSGTVELGATVSSGCATQVLEGVRFFVDGVFVGEDRVKPFSIPWRSALSSPGRHVLTAQLVANDGRTWSSQARDVVVARQAAPRLAGQDRYQTAAEVSAASVASPVQRVYIATGAQFPDALAAAAAAGARGSPLLLVGSTIPESVRTELERLEPLQVVVVGGTGAVPDAVARQLVAYAPSVRRLAGADRYSTAVAMSQSAFTAPAPIAVLANGSSFADALAGAALAGSLGGPVLLTATDGLPSSTAAELTRLRPERVVVVGGTGAVSASVLAAVDALVAGPVSRVGGADRYATAAAVSGLFPADVDAAFVATGSNFPDALGGAAAAGGRGSPVLLVPATTIPAAVEAALRRLSPLQIPVLGGSGVVSDAVRSELATYAG